MKPGKDYVGVGVGAMVFNDRGELLLIERGLAAKNERGFWQIPGGTVDFGETLEQAVVREIKEELGIEVVVEHQLPAVDHLIPDEGQHWVATAFVARIQPGQTPKIQESHKHSGLGWFALDNLPKKLAITMKRGLELYNKHIMLGNSAPNRPKPKKVQDHDRNN